MNSVWGRPTRLFIFAVLSGILTGAFTFICKEYVSEWYGILFGSLLMLAALPLCFLAKKRGAWFYIIGAACNAAGSGFSIGAYYSHINLPIGIDTILNVTMMFIAALFCAFTLITLIRRKKISGAIVVASLLLMITGTGIVWARKNSDFISYSFFLLIWLLFYCITGLITLKTSRNLWRDVYWGSFGGFFVVLFLVLIVLSEGEAVGDAIDGIGGSWNTKNKRAG